LACAVEKACELSTFESVVPGYIPFEPQQGYLVNHKNDLPTRTAIGP